VLPDGTSEAALASDARVFVGKNQIVYHYAAPCAFKSSCHAALPANASETMREEVAFPTTSLSLISIGPGVKVPVGDAQPRFQREALAARGPKISR
jgi:hypothetical protein